MKTNSSTHKTLADIPGTRFEVKTDKILHSSILLLIAFLFFNPFAYGVKPTNNTLNKNVHHCFFTDSTESSTGINLPNTELKPNYDKDSNSNNNPPATIPDLVFCINGTEATEGFTLSLCSSTPFEFSICDIIDGVAPFTICFTFDGDPECVQGIESGDILLNTALNPGTHNIEIISLMDALGNSSPNTDELAFTIQASNPPSAETGIDATICESTGHVLNQASAESYSSLLWTAGDGTFIPSADVLNPMYMPGPNDIEDGNVEVSLTVNAINPCTVPATDCMTLSIWHEAVSNAGPDVVVCEDQGYVELSGDIQNGLPVWEASQYTGGFFEDPLSTSTKYYFSSQDIELGIIQLTLIAIPRAPCVLPQSDYLEVTIIESPEAFAGEDVTITNTEHVALTQAAVENAGAIEWSTNGDGTFSNSYELNSTFFPGPVDIAEGEAKLILTAMPLDGCTVYSMDLITIDIIQADSFENPEQTSFKKSPFAETTETTSTGMEINVFPNPAADFINITSYKEISKIRMINNSGKQVMVEKVLGTSGTIQISHLEKGIYIMVIEFRDQKRSTKKITIR